MRQSQLFTKTRKEAPKDEVSRNASLLVRAGFINKEMAGVYSYLPLGLKVIKNIENIIREELNKVGGQEMIMSTMHPKENWEKTGRWDSMDVLYKVVDSSKKEIALGPTHEEIVTPIAKQYISSYKDLPFSVYQFQNKFRMELRAKSGILRGREFLMKDMYSFHTDESDLQVFYEKMKGVYKKIFNRIDIGKDTHVTFASGGSFSKYSHEFQTLAKTGEDSVNICKKCGTGINNEIIAEQKECPECGSSDFTSEKAIEVGNIFQLKTKFSDPFELKYKDNGGNLKPVFMGCYGIGIARLMGTVAEVLSDDKGLVWPESISPFKVHLISLGDNSKVKKQADKIYDLLIKNGVDVLYDDRSVRAGEKFADADLMGISNSIIIGEKSLISKKFEYKNRKTGIVRMLSEKEILAKLTK